MTTLVGDLAALLLERQAVNLDDVVQHAGEDLDHLAVFRPVELRLRGEGLLHEAGEIHGAQQARTVRRQRLLTAGVGGAHVFAPPVVVHLIDAVDENEARLGEVVGGGHDDVPHAASRQSLVDLAADQTVFAADIAFVLRPLAPHELGRVREVHGGGVVFTGGQREGQLPLAVVLHGLDELVRDEQGQVELAQTAVFPLRLDELERVRMADIEGAHLCAAATAGRRHGEAHLVVDIHERQRARGVRASARHVSATGAQRGELVANATTGLQRQASLVHLVEDVIHGVADGAGHGAVDGAGGRLVSQSAGIGGDAPGGNGTLLLRPQEQVEPMLALLGGFHFGQGTGNTAVRVVHGVVHNGTILGGKAVLLLPDIERGFLIGDLIHVFRLELEGRTHGG